MVIYMVVQQWRLPILCSASKSFLRRPHELCTRVFLADGLLFFSPFQHPLLYRSVTSSYLGCFSYFQNLIFYETIDFSSPKSTQQCRRPSTAVVANLEISSAWAVFLILDKPENNFLFFSFLFSSPRVRTSFLAASWWCPWTRPPRGRVVIYYTLGRA